jgi:undecaprenyl phosphate N,N'-diacetylbacillosamine 1-phosphate transferase
MDILLSIFLLPLFFLFLLPISVLIKIEDSGTIFYSSSRLGKRRIPFQMFKFRTMKVNAPDIRLEDGSTFNSNNDSRVTKIGKFLRETSIDELPQLFNVILGDMSFVGPRPDVQSSTVFPKEYKRVFLVKPGITGYNQAFFRNESSRLEKLNNDLFYINHFSFLLDLKILFQTIKILFLKKGTYKVIENENSRNRG